MSCQKCCQSDVLGFVVMWLSVWCVELCGHVTICPIYFRLCGHVTVSLMCQALWSMTVSLGHDESEPNHDSVYYVGLRGVWKHHIMITMWPSWSLYYKVNRRVCNSVRHSLYSQWKGYTCILDHSGKSLATSYRLYMSSHSLCMWKMQGMSSIRHGTCTGTP